MPPPPTGRRRLPPRFMRAAPAAPIAPAGSIAPAPAEPFGQGGIHKHVGPAFVLLSVIFASFCAIMWNRSMTLSDVLVRSGDYKIYSIRSIVGHIAISRTDLAPETNLVPRMPRWSYVLEQVAPESPDAWRDTLWKAIGIEWQSDPIIHHVAIVDGWWIRIRWRTLTILGFVVPALHVIGGMRNRSVNS